MNPLYKDISKGLLNFGIVQLTFNNEFPCVVSGVYIVLLHQIHLTGFVMQNNSFVDFNYDIIKHFGNIDFQVKNFWSGLVPDKQKVLKR